MPKIKKKKKKKKKGFSAFSFQSLDSSLSSHSRNRKAIDALGEEAPRWAQGYTHTHTRRPK